MARTLVGMLETPAADAVTISYNRHPETVRADARAFRAKQRAADIAPLSDKVVYPRKLVDAPPPPKKGRQGK